MKTEKYSSIEQIVGEASSKITFHESLSLDKAEKYLEMKECIAIATLSVSEIEEKDNFLFRSECVLEIKDGDNIVGWISIEPKDAQKPFIGISVQSQAEDVLRSNYENYCENNEDEEITFREYVESDSESDPNFFSWLFADNLESYGDNMMETHKEAWKSFLNSL